MTYLLDTHYLLWSLFEPDKVVGQAKQILEDEQSTKLISGVSLWEISIKYSLGKLELGSSTPTQVFETAKEAGFKVLDIENEVLASYFELPKKENHKDPFDRLLIWQAILNEYVLLTQDKQIEQYRNDGLELVLI